jgi:hypothetical protein
MTRAGNSAMTLIMLAIFAVLVGVAATYPPGARFMPFVVGIPALGLCLLQLVLDARERRLRPVATEGSVGSDALSPRETVHREIVMWAYFLAFVAGVLLFGFWISIPLFLMAFLRHQAKAGWATALVMSIGATLILYAALVMAFRLEVHPGFVTEYAWERMVGS